MTLTEEKAFFKMLLHFATSSYEDNIICDEKKKVSYMSTYCFQNSFEIILQFSNLESINNEALTLIELSITVFQRCILHVLDNCRRLIYRGQRGG